MSNKYCGKWPPDPRCLARNASAAAGRVVSATIRGERVIAPVEVQKEREAICRSNQCGKFFEDRGRIRCKACGCYMGGVVGKWKWTTEKCPLGLWNQ